MVDAPPPQVEELPFNDDSPFTVDILATFEVTNVPMPDLTR